jgi:hypothetical protein
MRFGLVATAFSRVADPTQRDDRKIKQALPARRATVLHWLVCDSVRRSDCLTVRLLSGAGLTGLSAVRYEPRMLFCVAGISVVCVKRLRLPWGC